MDTCLWLARLNPSPDRDDLAATKSGKAHLSLDPLIKQFHVPSNAGSEHEQVSHDSHVT